MPPDKWRADDRDEETSPPTSRDDIAARLVELESYASPEELGRLGPTLQAAKEGTSCVDLSPMGDAGDTVLDDLTEMAKVPVGRDLIDATSEDPQGDRVRFEPLAPERPPATVPLGPGGNRFYHSVDGQCVPMSDAMPTGADASVRYSPGKEIRTGDEPWQTYPAHVSLFHELVHAEHIQQGTNTLVKGDACIPDWVKRSGQAYHEENRTTGVGGYEEPFTENTYREQHRAIGDDLPNRDYYYSSRSE